MRHLRGHHPMGGRRNENLCTLKISGYATSWEYLCISVDKIENFGSTGRDVFRGHRCTIMGSRACKKKMKIFSTFFRFENLFSLDILFVWFLCVRI